MKSDEARRNWRDVLEYVRSGGTVIVEHYQRPVAAVVPLDDQHEGATDADNPR